MPKTLSLYLSGLLIGTFLATFLSFKMGFCEHIDFKFYFFIYLCLNVITFTFLFLINNFLFKYHFNLTLFIIGFLYSVLIVFGDVFISWIKKEVLHLGKPIFLLNFIIFPLLVYFLLVAIDNFKCFKKH